MVFFIWSSGFGLIGLSQNHCPRTLILVNYTGTFIAAPGEESFQLFCTILILLKSGVRFTKVSTTIIVVNEHFSN